MFEILVLIRVMIILSYTAESFLGGKVQCVGKRGAVGRGQISRSDVIESISESSKGKEDVHLSYSIILNTSATDYP